MEPTILILHTNGDTSYIDVLPTHNLSDARVIIQKEFDVDQLPSRIFQFKVNGLRVSSAQEKRHIVADINREAKKVEIVCRLPPLPANDITPPSNMSFANIGTNVNHQMSKQERTVYEEAVACMDSSRSTVSGIKLFKPIGGDSAQAVEAGQVNRAAFDIPTPKKPPQIQQQHGSKPSTETAGTLPQKRCANSSIKSVECKKNNWLNSDPNKKKIARESAKRDATIMQEYGADYERYTEKPSQNSSLSSDGSNKISAEKSSTVKRIELKRTVEIFDLCDSDEEDYKPATSDLKPAFTTAPTVKDFTLMNGKERKMYWSDKNNLSIFFKRTLSNLTGAECEVCAETGVDKRCNSCGKFYHGVCVDESSHIVCLACQMNDRQCHLCNHKGGIVVKSFARPGSMKKWKGKQTEYRKSLFGNDKFCHAICGIFNPLTRIECSSDDRDHTVIDCSGLVMSDGRSHILGHTCCQLCGMTNGAKVKCDECKDVFHVTCARQAGLEVADGHPLRCFKHVRCEFVLRARLEDMIFAEKARWSSNSFKPDAPMHWNHAASMLHYAIDTLRTLGWAWRWADWWIAEGDNWQPFLEDDQDEADMSDEDVGRVPSSPESRALDVRRCCLKDFGAALRNRAYDGVESETLERALTIVLSTKSLVGPLEKDEIEFLTTWLSLAYKSESHKLGFGVDKIPASNDGFCVRKDGSLKHVLGNRRLPGKKIIVRRK